MDNRIEVTCPKCNGTKSFRTWSHIAGGRCFTCSGNGTILVRPSVAAAATQVAPRPEVVTIPGLGRADVYPDRLVLHQGANGLDVYIDRTPSGVKVAMVCDGLKRRRAEVVAAVEAWGMAA